MSSTSEIAVRLKANLAQIQANMGFQTLLLAVTISLGLWVFVQTRRKNDPKANVISNEEKAPKLELRRTKNTHIPQNVRVSRLLVHPIKSCRGISVDQVAYTPEGVEFDRLWAIIDSNKQAIITAREVPKLVLVSPQIERDDSLPHLGQLIVTFPSSAECDTVTVPLRPTESILRQWKILPQIQIWPTHGPVDGYICESLDPEGPSPSEVLSKYIGRQVNLVYKGPRPREIDPTTLFPKLQATAKYQDMYPLLVLSEESTSSVDEELRKHVGTQGIDESWKTGNVAIERFRPNIIFSGGGPFAEDDWEQITLGTEDAPTITLVSKCTRCLLPNVSPETGVRDAAVPYKVLMKFRTGLDPKHKFKPCVGCNGVPSGNGVVQIGDKVFIKRLLED